MLYPIHTLCRTLSFEESAALPTAALAGLKALRKIGNLKSGGSVLVVGASGGCGSIGLSLAR